MIIGSLSPAMFAAAEAAEEEKEAARAESRSNKCRIS